MKWKLTLENGDKLFFYSLEELGRYVTAEDLSVDKIEKVPEGYAFKESDRAVTEYTNVNVSIFSIDSKMNGKGWKSEYMVRSIRYPDGKTCYRDIVDPVAMLNDKEDVIGRLSKFVSKLWFKNHPST